MEQSCCMWADRQTMMQQVVALQNFVNAPKYIEVQCEVFHKLLRGARTKHIHTAHYKLSLRAGEVNILIGIITQYTAENKGPFTH